MCKPVCHAVGSTVPHLRMLNNMTPRPSNLRPRVFPRAKIRLALADWWDEYTNSSLRHPRCGAQARKRGGTVFDVQPLVSGPEAVIALLRLKPADNHRHHVGFRYLSQSTGADCRRQPRLTLTDAGWKAARPFWARLACHRRRRLESFRSPWAGKRRIFLPPSSLVPKIRLRAIAWTMVVNATSAPHWSRRSPLVIVLGTEPPLVSVFVFGRRVVARVHGAHGSGAICRELGVMHGGFQST